jgi:hypothetical protein
MNNNNRTNHLMKVAARGAVALLGAALLGCGSSSTHAPSGGNPPARPGGPAPRCARRA